MKGGENLEEDVVPGLLESINQQFIDKAGSNTKLIECMKRIKLNKATYIDANNFSVEVGNILASVLNSSISVDTLPDGKMYYNIADRLLNSTLKNNYDLITDYTSDVQTQLNKRAGYGIKAQVPELNHDRIEGIVNRISSESDFDKIKWLLDEPIVTFCQSIVDDSIEKNVDFQVKSGLQPKITRTVVGKACKWCKGLAGTYDYFNKPDDIYRRHERCRCTVEYDPGNGRKQNSWTKKWVDPNKDAKIEARKRIGLTDQIASGAKHYFRDDKDDFLRSPEYVKRDQYAYSQYDEIKNSNQKIEKRKIYSNLGKHREMQYFSKQDVDIAFDHVFNDMHELENGSSLFTPDPDMASSWSRLISGKSIQPHDLTLLQHERLEHEYMYISQKMDYSTAHKMANEVYNYFGDLQKDLAEGKY